MTIHDAINEYLKQCEARKLSWSTLKAYRCDLEILDRSQRHTELLDIESEELQKIIKGNGSLKPATMLRRSVSFHIFFHLSKYHLDQIERYNLLLHTTRHSRN